MGNAIDILRERHLLDDVTSPDVGERLASPVTVYAGFDPSSDSLQAGDGARLLRRLWMAVAGLEPLARPRGAVLLALHEPELHWLKVDFEDELRALLEAFLTDRT